MKRRTALVLLLAILLATSACDLLPGGSGPGASGQGTAVPGSPVAGPEDRIDGYLAVAPKALRSAQPETVSVSIFDGDRPANATVQVSLLKDGKPLATSASYLQGRGDLRLDVPRLAEGDYQLQLQRQWLPGRVPGPSRGRHPGLRRDRQADLQARPDHPHPHPDARSSAASRSRGPSTVEVMDAKGLKVFKRDVNHRRLRHGVARPAALDRAEPRRLEGHGEGRQADRPAGRPGRAVRAAQVRGARSTCRRTGCWRATRSPAPSSAEYSYGKPVQGEVQIRATPLRRHLAGVRQRHQAPGRQAPTSSLPAVRYVSGVPGRGRHGQRPARGDGAREVDRLRGEDHAAAHGGADPARAEGDTRERRLQAVAAAVAAGARRDARQEAARRRRSAEPHLHEEGLQPHPGDAARSSVEAGQGDGAGDAAGRRDLAHA